MKYKITHTTAYQYNAPVSMCQNLVILAPKEGPRITCQSHRLHVRPHPAHVNRRTDFFGNLLHMIDIDQRHSRLVIRSTSHVKVETSAGGHLGPQATPAWETVRDRVLDQTDANWLDASLYRFDSPRITRGPQFENYARGSFSAGRPVLSALLDLTGRIHRDFKYDPRSTNVNTLPEDVFRIKKGVCQDFAHVIVACLRSIGIPAQYVSGYLRTNPTPGKERLLGADASHAWATVYCSDSVGWIPVDPTNNCLCQTDHIPIATGRDYGDVVPLRGVYLGGGDHTLKVTVDVQPDTK